MGKPEAVDRKVMVLDRSSGKFSTMRIIIGVFLSILFVVKDLAGVIFFGIVRLFTESLRWLIRVTITLAEEITVTFVRVILRGIEELLNVVISIVFQVADNASQVIMRGVRHIFSLFGYLVVVVGFAVAYVAHRIISFFFSGR